MEDERVEELFIFVEGGAVVDDENFGFERGGGEDGDEFPEIGGEAVRLAIGGYYE